MPIAGPRALSRPPIGGRGGAFFAVVILALAGPGCARDRHEITPTTLGTDLKRMPKGRMTPYPWPGQSIVEARPRTAGPTVDPETARASAGLPPG